MCRLRPASASPCYTTARVVARGHRSVAAGAKFDALGLNPASLRALQEVFHFERMTRVQARALPPLLLAAREGSDVVFCARAGTGKTLSYLLPALEHITRNPPVGVGALVVAPSRELVLQIAREALLLCTYQSCRPVVLAGGVSSRWEAQALRHGALVVATPGPLLERAETSAAFRAALGVSGMLVLDECDALLQEHAAPLQDLLGFLHTGCRRFLVSATVTREIQDYATQVCRPGYARIDDAALSGAAPQVEEAFVPCPPILLLTALANSIAEEVAARPTSHKIIAFFPTARLCALFAELFRSQLQMRIHELHARCGASARHHAHEAFSACGTGTLFASGASERVVDYAGVTLVLQVLAPSAEQYAQRVGRTGRGLATGRAVLLLLEGVPSLDLGLPRDASCRQLLHDAGDRVARAVSSVNWAPGSPLPSLAAAAFASLLQHLRVPRRALSPMPGERAVAIAAELMLGCGVVEIPSVSQALAVELGLLSCSALRVTSVTQSAGAVAEVPAQSPSPCVAGTSEPRHDS